MGIIGTVMKDGGLEDILIESNVYGGAAVAKILEGKSYNRGIRAHKIVYEAMWRLKLQAFGDLMASGKILQMRRVTILWMHYKNVCFILVNQQSNGNKTHNPACIINKCSTKSGVIKSLSTDV